MGRILAQWQYPVASSVATVLFYWEMRSALYRPIQMAVKMTSEGGVFFCNR